jgi:hypothetical protein
MFKVYFQTLTLCFILIFSIASEAKQNKLLRCLAKEEEILFKKTKQDALYRLNQEFVNELASSNDISIKNNYLNEICQSRTYSPSVSLLRLLMLKEHEVFDLSLSEIDPQLRPFKMGYIYEFQKQVPRIFISYISALQLEMSTANCLEKRIPELKGLSENLKHLEMETTTRSLMANKKKIEAIFVKLQALKAIKKSCYEEMLSKKRRQKK